MQLMHRPLQVAILQQIQLPICLPHQAVILLLQPWSLQLLQAVILLLQPWSLQLLQAAIFLLIQSSSLQLLQHQFQAFVQFRVPALLCSLLTLARILDLNLTLCHGEDRPGTQGRSMKMAVLFALED